MKNRYLFLIAVLICAVSVVLPAAYAEDNDTTRDLLKEGLVDAGAGERVEAPVEAAEEAPVEATEGAPVEEKGKYLWNGALAGAGVNIVGGELLDSLSGEKVENVQQVDASSPRDAYSDGYQEGYQNGYKAGYTEGYREGLKESGVKAQ